MAKRGRPPKGTQLDLIDVGPENLKKILPLAREYKELVKGRMAILDQEVAAKKRLLELVKEAKLKPGEDGKIRFRADGMTITVTPTDFKIKIKDENPTE